MLRWKELVSPPPRVGLAFYLYVLIPAALSKKKITSAHVSFCFVIQTNSVTYVLYCLLDITPMRVVQVLHPFFLTSFFGLPKGVIGSPLPFTKHNPVTPPLLVQTPAHRVRLDACDIYEIKPGTGVQCSQQGISFDCGSAHSICATLDDDNYNFQKFGFRHVMKGDNSTHIQFVASRTMGRGTTHGSPRKQCEAMVNTCCDSGLLRGALVGWNSDSTAKGGFSLNAEYWQ